MMEGDSFPCLSTVSEVDDDNSSRTRHTFLELWLKAIPLVLLAFLTVTFNLMVLWMFKVKRSLRSCKNIYLASLALADLIIGLCMFLATVQQVKGHVRWFPVFWCRLYLVLRQSALYVSLLSLVLITGDRWWSVHYPFSYRARRRKKNALIAVGCVWLFSFILHVFPIALWDFIVDRNPVSANSSSLDTDLHKHEHEHSTSCELPFSDSLLFVSIVSAVQYFIPLMSMLTLNCSLYLGILQRKRVQIRRSVTSSEKLTSSDRRTSISSIPDYPSQIPETMQLLNGCGPTLNPPRQISLRRNSADVVLLRSYRSSPAFSNLTPPVVSAARRFSWAPRKTSLRPSKGCEELAKSLLVKQDRKAAFWLALLVVVFLVCWLPYSVVGILHAAWYNSVPQWAMDVTFWFLLANSAINPLLYGLFNKEIWLAFRHWFCGTPNRQWRANNALLFYGVALNAAVTMPRRISSFDAVPE